jgi:hypothetical protein
MCLTFAPSSHGDKAVKFFIPHLSEDRAEAEVEWERYLRESPAPPNSRGRQGSWAYA